MRTKQPRRAHIIRACDGDTLVALVQCPECHIFHERRLRLARIDSHELSGPERALAMRTRDAVTLLLHNKEATVHIVKSSPDLYGRDIAEVFVDALNVSDSLVERGHAWYRSPNERTHARE